MSDPATGLGTNGATFHNSNASDDAEETSGHEFNRRAERESVRAADRMRRLEPTTDEHGSVPYSYGPPAAAERESNYISDDNLLLWLAQKQDGLYGELRDRMDMSRERSKLIEDLSHLKVRLDNEGTTAEQAMQEMQALLEAYAGTPFEAKLRELIEPSLDRMGVKLEFAPLGSLGNQITVEIPDDFSEMPYKMEAKSLSPSIQAYVDALGHDDQLELIEIQSLTSDINEAAQLTSNLLANGNQTANTILGNIGR